MLAKLEGYESNCFFDEGRGYEYGARRARTADPLHAMQVLSQLSYSPKVKMLFHYIIEYHNGTRISR